MNKKILLVITFLITAALIVGGAYLNITPMILAGFICVIPLGVIIYLCSKEQRAYNEKHKIKVIHFRDNLDHIGNAARNIKRSVNNVSNMSKSSGISIRIGGSSSNNRGYDSNAVKSINYYTESELKRMVKLRALFGRYQILYPENYDGEDFGPGNY